MRILLTRQSRQASLSVINVSLLFTSVAATCYFPNGTDRNIGSSAEIYRPCDGGGKHSMCCRTMDHDRCRSDGLCLNFQHNEIWRESCTDPTWQSPECLKLCVMGLDQHNEQMVLSDERVTACENGSFCCGMGPNSSKCCNQGKGVWVVNGITTDKNPWHLATESRPGTTLSSTWPNTRTDHIRSTPISSPPSSLSSQCTSTSTPTPSMSPSKPPNHTAPIIGGTVGGIASCSFSASFSFYFTGIRNLNGGR